MRCVIFAPILLFALGCPDDPSDNGGQDDAAAADAAAKDALVADATGHPDAADPADAADPQDAGDPLDSGELADAMSFPDADAPDAEPADAGEVDGGFQCGALGMACGRETQCPAGLVCNDIHHLCLPDRVIDCGGFVMAQCPATHPVCMYFSSADYGPCFTPNERNCICATPEGQAAFPDC